MAQEKDQRSRMKPAARRATGIILLLLCVAVLGFPVRTTASQITLKNSLLGGWRYSADSSEYQRVGYSARSLRDEIGPNEEALLELDKYSTNSVVATVAAIPAGALIGYPLGGYLVEEDWKDNYTNMMYAGVFMSLLSLFFDAEASSSLKRAVDLHNKREQEEMGFSIKPRIFANSSKAGPRLGLSWRF